MRPYITKIIAILVLVGAIFGAKQIAGSKKKNRPQSAENIPTAFVSHANTEVVPVSIIESGRLEAKHKIELFSEVQGVKEYTPKEFKPGTTYKKGEVLVKIKSEEFYANLQAQKSVLQNLLTSILPDIKLDFPEAYDKWDAYLDSYDMNKPITPLPEPGSEKEKFFLTGKNIYTTYYNTKNLEIIYSKYTLTAPYDGILTEALVTPGTLVRIGQKLGEFIDPTEYEMELAVSKDLIHAVSIGKEVLVTNPENRQQTWNGKVSRINGNVNPSTQTVQIFVLLKGEELKEGMYLEADIEGKERLDAIKLSRNLLIDETKIYVVRKDSTLHLTDVDVVHKSRNHIIIQGPDNGDWILYRPIPGAYAGMKVMVKQEK